MEAWESIQKTLDHIELNLKETMDMETLANLANLSPYYYQKLFRRLVGKPVMEYVKLRRLAQAADKLRLEGGKILNLAIEYGFNSHETFTRSFKETYGLTPESYRSQPLSLSHYIMPDLSMKYRLVDEGVPLVANGTVLEVRRQTVFKDRLFSGVSVQNPIQDTPGVDFLGELWKRHHEEFGSAIPYVLDERVEVGISSSGDKEGFFTYFAGSEVQKHTDEWLLHTDLYGQCENRKLPAGDYAVCTFDAENFHALATISLNKAIDYLLGTWLPRHGLACEGFLVEIYDHRCLGVEEGPEMDIMVKLVV